MPTHAIIFFVVMFVHQLSSAAPVTCQFAYSDISFGNINILSGTPFHAQGNLRVNCSNGKPGQNLRACSNLLAGSGGQSASGDPRYLSLENAKLAFNIFHDSGNQILWGAESSGSLSIPLQIDLTFDATGKAVGTIPVFAKIYPNQSTINTGFFQSYFDGSASYINYKVFPTAPTETCNAIDASGFRHAAPFNVSASYAGGCIVSASQASLDFGQVNTIGKNTFGETNLTFKCSSKLPFHVGLDKGINGTGVSRTMVNQTGQTLVYNLYKDSNHSVLWGNNVSIDTTQMTGSGNEQMITIYGSIPWQPEMSAGTYNDIVGVFFHH